MSKLRDLVQGLGHRAVPKLSHSIIINLFMKLAHERYGTYHNTYRGRVLYKWPEDLWIYQELIWECKPDLIVETGTFQGASALYFAHQMDLIGQGEVLTIDTESYAARPSHPRITYLTGSSIDPDTLEVVDQACVRKKRIMVVLDSDHSARHVQAELNALSHHVTPGSYLVVEDTIVNGHPVRSGHGAGPMEAVKEFLHRRSDFHIDPSRNRFLVSQSPNGYLRRTQECPDLII